MPNFELPVVVFYGTPEFAVPSLQILVENNFPVKAVVTAPDKPSGRGLQLQQSAVKQYAVANNIEVLQPLSLKDSEFIARLNEINPALQVVVAFRKLPEQVWKLPVLGTFNLHASLLPDYRGAAPINWTLINGDTETGLTSFLINEDIDTGNVLLSEKVSINPTDTAGDLHDRLMEKGAQLVLKSATGLANNSIIPVIQSLTMPDGKLPRPAPKIFKETCSIPWEKTNEEVYNHIRGLSPYPGAFSELIDENGNIITVKIFSVEVIEKKDTAEIGTILTDSRSFWEVSCGLGWVRLKVVQLPGKRKMTVIDLLNGYHLAAESRFKV